MVEGAPHTAKRSMINCYVYGVPPAPVYKGARGRRRPARERRTQVGAILLQVGLSPLSYSKKEKGEGGGGEKEGEGGRRPFPLSNLDWGKGAARHLLAAFSLLH